MLKLKKVINQIVNELESLGLQPEVLQEYIESESSASDLRLDSTERLDVEEGSSDAHQSRSRKGLPVGHGGSSGSRSGLSSRTASISPPPKVVYELHEDAASGKIEPQLRIWLNAPKSPPTMSPEFNGKQPKNFTDNDKEDSDINLLDGRLTQSLAREDEADGPGHGQSAVKFSHTTTNMTPTLLWALQRGLKERRNIGAKHE